MYGLSEIVAMNNQAYKDAQERKRKSKVIEIPKSLFWNLLRSLDANDLQQAKQDAEVINASLHL